MQHLCAIGGKQHTADMVTELTAQAPLVVMALVVAGCFATLLAWMILSLVDESRTADEIVRERITGPTNR